MLKGIERISHANISSTEIFGICFSYQPLPFVTPLVLNFVMALKVEAELDVATVLSVATMLGVATVLHKASMLHIVVLNIASVLDVIAIHSFAPPNKRYLPYYA